MILSHMASLSHRGQIISSTPVESVKANQRGLTNRKNGLYDGLLTDTTFSGTMFALVSLDLSRIMIHDLAWPARPPRTLLVTRRRRTA